MPAAWAPGSAAEAALSAAEAAAAEAALSAAWPTYGDGLG